MIARHVYGQHGQPDRYYLDGVEVTKAEYDLALPDRPFDPEADWQAALSQVPVNASTGMAVHPDQIPEAIESAKKKGVPTEFDSEGRPLFTSRAHQKAYLKAYNEHFQWGLRNRDGGYGD